jgi:hypothetical protein
MNISWVLAIGTQIEPTVSIDRLKELGSFWGGWQTWRGCQTDNVVCHDQIKANELVKRNFQSLCNLYVPNSVYVSLDRPTGVKLYEGNFVHEVDNHEDIVAMHLSAATSDIVLLLGFDFEEKPKQQDRLSEHMAHNYRSLTKQVITDHPLIQWVAINHTGELRKDLQNLPNLSQDTLSNILQTQS